ncbi:TPA: protein ipgB [Escherichia coli]|uniref:protein ipgB n=1 Tax=Escherichia coli TaxID=562 RepID=UPI000E1CF7C1|nr:protein ipgB [Escherichia coli]RDQ03945.1 IpaB/EvcA family protein [Escherichia coli]RDQ54393.1 IpaB/EvcA family protein [Escherichia coli]
MLTPLQITSQALNIQCNVKLDSISFSKGVFLQKIKSVFNSNKNLSSATSPQPTDINKIRNKVIARIKENNQGSYFYSWMSQERTNYISAMINKCIDEMALQNNIVLSKENRNRVFAAIERKLPDAKLDQRASQTSINHSTLNEISSSGLQEKLLKRYSHDMNEYNAHMKNISNKVSQSVYEKIFNESIKALDINIQAEVLKAAYQQVQ